MGMYCWCLGIGDDGRDGIMIDTFIEDDVIDEILDHTGDMIIDGDIEDSWDVGANDGSDFVDGTNVTW